MADEPLSEDRRKEIFSALVDAQDQGMSPPRSRMHVSEIYGISVGRVMQVERDGLDHQWPPLGNASV